MPTRETRSSARRFLEDLAGGALTLGRLLRAIREGEEWSLAAMGKKLGVSRAHVANIEKGKPVSPECAARYARALGHSEDQFVRLALQDELHRSGLDYRVELHAPARRRRTG